MRTSENALRVLVRHQRACPVEKGPLVRFHLALLRRDGPVGLHKPRQPHVHRFGLGPHLVVLHRGTHHEPPDQRDVITQSHAPSHDIAHTHTLTHHHHHHHSLTHHSFVESIHEREQSARQADFLERLAECCIHVALSCTSARTRWSSNDAQPVEHTRVDMALGKRPVMVPVGRTDDQKLWSRVASGSSKHNQPSGMDYAAGRRRCCCRHARRNGWTTTRRR